MGDRGGRVAARLRLGLASFGRGLDVPAEGRAYTEALTGDRVDLPRPAPRTAPRHPNTSTRFSTTGPLPLPARSAPAARPVPQLPVHKLRRPGNPGRSYGFASFDVVPHEPGGTTSITVTHYGADLESPVYSQRDQFVVRKSLDMDQQGDQLAGAVTTR